MYKDLPCSQTLILPSLRVHENNESLEDQRDWELGCKSLLKKVGTQARQHLVVHCM